MAAAVASQRPSTSLPPATSRRLGSYGSAWNRAQRRFPLAPHPLGAGRRTAACGPWHCHQHWRVDAVAWQLCLLRRIVVFCQVSKASVASTGHAWLLLYVIKGYLFSSSNPVDTVISSSNGIRLPLPGVLAHDIPIRHWRRHHRLLQQAVKQHPA